MQLWNRPWEEVYIDLIGPWDVQYNSTMEPGKSTIEKIHALTAIDKATGWPEFTAILNKTSYHVAILLNSIWLCLHVAILFNSIWLCLLSTTCKSHL